MMNSNVDAETCCKLPRPYYHPEFESQCVDQCSKLKKRVRCCIRKCRAEKLGIYANETFNKEALKDFLLSDNDEKRVREKWEETVNKAVDFCAERSKN